MLNLGETLQEQISHRKARAIHMKRLNEIKNRTPPGRNKVMLNTVKRRKFMLQERMNYLNKSNQALAQRLLAIGKNNSKTVDNNWVMNKPLKIRKLVISRLKRYSSLESKDRRSNEEHIRIQELVDKRMPDSSKKKRARSRQRCRQKYIRDQVISSMYTTRYNKIRTIEEENLKFAKRLYQKKPSISKKILENSFKSHLALKKRMSRFSQSRTRNSIAIEIARRKTSTSCQAKRLINKIPTFHSSIIPKSRTRTPSNQPSINPSL
ncbi:unnamed protein product [Moneuplotes crassus]|uniref:Uncharacterized protein n=1 Tax=Euplotes crassus TaxID=5936 RepID=A0AAD1XP72_EUPCR|nr:unnamed protein product [Moneuplotes crassus]